jgi:hypothetical protein
MVTNLNPETRELERTNFPEYPVFAQSCRRGLSTVYPFKQGVADDLYGWKFGARWPPSYWAFGRMRALLAIHDALLLKPRRALEVAAGDGGVSASLAGQPLVKLADLTELLSQRLPSAVRTRSCAALSATLRLP